MNNLRDRFEEEMASLRFRGNRELALAWRRWHNANRPTLIQHLKKLWRTLRKQHHVQSTNSVL